MDVVVFTKFVPNPQGTPELGPDHRLVRTAEGALDPGDEYGLELALQLAETEGANVIAVSMGPDEAVTAVQRALAMGAHEGVAHHRPGVARRRCARHRSGARRDGRAAIMGSRDRGRGVHRRVHGHRAGDRRGTPRCSGGERRPEARTDPSGIRVERQVEAGYDVLECGLPAVITVTAGANEPRYPSLKGIMQAKQKPLERLGLVDLGLSAEDVAATQTVVEVTDAPAVAGGEVIVADDDAVARIADLLAEAKVI